MQKLFLLYCRIAALLCMTSAQVPDKIYDAKYPQCKIELQR